MQLYLFIIVPRWTFQGFYQTFSSRFPTLAGHFSVFYPQINKQNHQVVTSTLLSHWQWSQYKYHTRSIVYSCYRRYISTTNEECIERQNAFPWVKEKLMPPTRIERVTFSLQVRRATTTPRRLILDFHQHNTLCSSGFTFVPDSAVI